MVSLVKLVGSIVGIPEGRVVPSEFNYVLFSVYPFIALARDMGNIHPLSVCCSKPGLGMEA